MAKRVQYIIIQCHTVPQRDSLYTFVPPDLNNSKANAQGQHTFFPH